MVEVYTHNTRFQCRVTPFVGELHVEKAADLANSGQLSEIFGSQQVDFQFQQRQRVKTVG